MKISCPGCKSQNEIEAHFIAEWSEDGGVPICCDKCGTMYMVPIGMEIAHQGIIFEPPTMSTIKIGTRVYIYNREHKLHMRPGEIVAKDHCNYRIKFKDGIRIWVPHHWVKVMPKFQE